MKTYAINELFDLLNIAGVDWKNFLRENNLSEQVNGLYLEAPERLEYGSNDLIGRDGRMKSTLSADEYDALYRHWKLRPDGGPDSRNPAPLLPIPFTAEEFMRFENLLVDELRDVLTLWVDEDGELSQVVNQKLIDRLPLGPQELARLLLGEVVESAGIHSLVSVLQPAAVVGRESIASARQPPHVLTPAVKQAIQKTPHPITWQRVWGVLVDLAKKEDRPHPLTGYKDDELVYENQKSRKDQCAPGFMSREAFSRNWRRQWKALVSNLK